MTRDGRAVMRTRPRKSNSIGMRSNLFRIVCATDSFLRDTTPAYGLLFDDVGARRFWHAVRCRRLVRKTHLIRAIISLAEVGDMYSQKPRVYDRPTDLKSDGKSKLPIR